jgi:hypothetical protein
VKTTLTYEKGDRVQVTATQDYGLCFNNSVGGTESHLVGKPVKVTVRKTWWDGEIGRRYIGRTDKGKEYYFGEFGVKVALLSPARVSTRITE